MIVGQDMLSISHSNLNSNGGCFHYLQQCFCFVWFFSAFFDRQLDFILLEQRGKREIEAIKAS